MKLAPFHGDVAKLLLVLINLVPGLKLGKVVKYIVSPSGFITDLQHPGVDVAVALHDFLGLVAWLHVDVLELGLVFRGTHDLDIICIIVSHYRNGGWLL